MERYLETWQYSADGSPLEVAVTTSVPVNTYIAPAYVMIEFF